jgi:hypothetical protein
VKNRSRRKTKPSEDVADIGESDNTCPLPEDKASNKGKRTKSPKKTRTEGSNEPKEEEEQQPPDMTQEGKGIRSEKHSDSNVGNPNKKQHQVNQETTERLVNKNKKGTDITQGPKNKSKTYLTQDTREMFGDSDEEVSYFQPSDTLRYANGEYSEDEDDEDDEDFQRRKRAASQVGKKHLAWVEQHNRIKKERQEIQLNELRIVRDRAEALEESEATQRERFNEIMNEVFVRTKLEREA